MKKPSIKAKRVSPIPPSPKMLRQRMSKEEVYKEYVRPIEYLAKNRSPKLILHKRKKQDMVR